MNFADLIEGNFVTLRRFVFIAWWEPTGWILKAMSRTHDAGWGLRYKVSHAIIDFGKKKEEDEA